MRQPYGHRLASTVVYAHPSWYAQQGYLVFVQDVRGCGESEGEFQGFSQEISDGSSSLLAADENGTASIRNAGGALYFGHHGSAGTFASSIGAGIALRGYGVIDDWQSTTLTLAGTVEADVANQTLSISSNLQSLANNGTPRASAGPP